MKVEIRKIMKIFIMACVSIAFHFPLSTFHFLYAQFSVTHLDKPYNTPGSETGAIVVGDTVLVYASTQQMAGQNRMFSFNPRVMQLYQARIAKNGRVSKPRLNRWKLNNDRCHTGNIAVDPRTGDLYFTRCDIRDTSLASHIYVARRVKRSWQKPEALDGDVNLKGFTSTHPAVGYTDDGSTILYFVSNRPGGMGGMDIWYTVISDGKPGICTNLGAPVNTASDEVTPFYDIRNRTLYFSSDREGGMGGHDIYCSFGSRNSWQPPAPICHCMNSRYNDIYFTITRYEGQLPIEGYLSSNREDSFFITDSTCCNDLYQWRLDSIPEPPDTMPEPDTVDYAKLRADSLRRERERILMAVYPLYFHNDEPNPRSRDTVTLTPYSDCYASYMSLHKVYADAQPDSLQGDIDRFFDATLPEAYRRLDTLLGLLADTLDAGARVIVTVAGFASPKHTSDYNLNLSSRRIASLVEHIRHWHGGRMASHIDEGHIVVVRRPNGSGGQIVDDADDPVFSPAAIHARRIEIQSVKIIP